MNYPWGHSRRFNAYANFFQKHFGERLQKVSINAGFTCPNRDGTVGKGGCSFCNNSAFSPTYCMEKLSIREQIDEGIRFHNTRYRRSTRFIAYFQSFSNTYANIEQLKKTYLKAIEHPNIVGLVIGTRPDCIDEEKLAFFSELSKKMYVIIEYGIESCYNKTLQRINRGHSFEDSVQAIELTHKHGIHCGGHLIFGLPGENKKDMLQEAKILSKLPLSNIKFHQLQLIRGSAMEKDYKDKPNDFHFFALEEYLDFIVSFIEQLNPAFIIERIAGEAHPDHNITPIQWGVRNEQVIQRFETLLENRNTWQGKKYTHYAIH